MKSEKNYPFTLFEKWKVKWFFLSLFSRSESEIEIPRDRDREVKFQNISREFSRNETLAGYCHKPLLGFFSRDGATSGREPSAGCQGWWWSTPWGASPSWTGSNFSFNFQHSVDHYRLTNDNQNDLSKVSSSKASISSLNTVKTGWMSRCLLWTFHAENITR